MDGFFDILLYKINLLDNEMRQTGYFNIPTPPMVIAAADADKHYTDLMSLLHLEQNEIRNTCENELRTQKAAKKRIQKKVANNPRFFEEKTATATTKPLTAEATLYLQAGRQRQSGISDLSKQIVLYEQIVNKYLEEVKDPTKSPDYFYVAASMAELADCYIRQGLSLTQKNFCHTEENVIPMIIKQYNHALTYAQLADECFVTHVVALPVASQKDFEDLASHIHDLLKLAAKNLEYMQNKFQKLADNIEKTQQKLADARAEAISRIGINNWRNNPNRKNTYAEIRKQNSHELERLKSAEKMLTQFIAMKFAPVKNDFAYLRGAGLLPLLLASPTAKDIHATNEAFHGKGFFTERLYLLSCSTKLLQEGKQPHQAIRLLMPSQPETSTALVTITNRI